MRALICGVTGQDGGYLAKLLLSKGYEVIGTSRDSMMSRSSNLDYLGVSSEVQVISMATNDFRSVLNAIQRFKPDEIYNLSGQTSVGLSFEQPVEAMESISGGTLILLEALRFFNKPIRFYNAGSSECFGDTSGESATENSPFFPRSPYASAKASAHWLLRNYREAYGLFACTGFLFNHESPLRPERFVTQKIVKAAARISMGSNEILELGNIDIRRDWGWAEDYVEAMWLILQQEKPDDFIVATGQTKSLKDFIMRAFLFFDLDWENHVKINTDLFRPSDLRVSSGNPKKAFVKLGWTAQTKFDQIIDEMCISARSQLV
jgi:GDPmannose 4,6-dehydratase